MTTKEDACKNFFEEDFVLCTPQQHKAMCLEVINDTSSAEEKSIEYGINERSVLNDVVGFSVIGGLCLAL